MSGSNSSNTEHLLASTRRHKLLVNNNLTYIYGLLHDNNVSHSSDVPTCMFSASMISNSERGGGGSLLM
jgi:hypothetical protein